MSFQETKRRLIIFLFIDDLKLYSHNDKELELLVQTIRIFNKDIGMDFGKEKCSMLVIEKGKIVMETSWRDTFDSY